MIDCQKCGNNIKGSEDVYEGFEGDLICKSCMEQERDSAEHQNDLRKGK